MVNIGIKIDDAVVGSVTDIGHAVAHIKMYAKVKQHLLDVRKKEREYRQKKLKARL